VRVVKPDEKTDAPGDKEKDKDEDKK
jgi:hypothetical protein